MKSKSCTAAAEGGVLIHFPVKRREMQNGPEYYNSVVPPVDGKAYRLKRVLEQLLKMQEYLNDG